MADEKREKLRKGKPFRKKALSVIRRKGRNKEDANAEQKATTVVKILIRSMLYILAPVILPVLVCIGGLLGVLSFIGGGSKLNDDDLSRSLFDSMSVYDNEIGKKLAEAGYKKEDNETVFVRGDIEGIYDCVYTLYAVNYVMYGEGKDLTESVREQFLEMNNVTVKKYSVTDFAEGKDQVKNAEGEMVSLPVKEENQDEEESGEVKDDEVEESDEEKDEDEIDDSSGTSEEKKPVNNYWTVNLSSIPAESIISRYSLDSEQREELDQLLSAEGRDMTGRTEVDIGLFDSSARTNMLLIAEDEVGQDAKKYLEDYGFTDTEGLDSEFTFIAYLANKLHLCHLPEDEMGRMTDYSFPYTANLDYSINWFKKTGQWRDAGYSPKMGDLVYLETVEEEGKEQCTGVGLVIDTESGTFRYLTIEDDKVIEKSKSEENKAFGYARIDYERLSVH